MYDCTLTDLCFVTMYVYYILLYTCQVKNMSGDFVEAIPMKGTALVNIGDITEMCTGGRLKSTVSYSILC